MDVDELDAAILSHARKLWRKVAMIAGRTLEEKGIAPSDDQVEVVIARIRNLIARGRLVAKGDLSRPRFTEVRLPGDEDG